MRQHAAITGLTVLLACTQDAGPKEQRPDTASSPPPSSTTTTPTPTEETLVLSGDASELTVRETSPCSDPTLRETLGPFERLVLHENSVSERHVWGGVIIAADFDPATDGPEILLPHEEGASYLVGDGEGGWEDLFEHQFPDIDVVRGVGGAAADWDGDGDLDLVLTRYEATDLLLRNDGAEFSVAQELESWRTQSAAWADMDADGDLDLAIGTYHSVPLSLIDPEQNRLYRNDDGVLVDVSARLPPETNGYTFQVSWVDIEPDRQPELLILNDAPVVAETATLEIDGDGPLQRDEEAGFHPMFASMGVGIGDLNADGHPDLVETSQDRASLMLSFPRAEARSGVTWFNYATGRGLTLDRARGQRFGWGVELVDLDHDGDLDAPMIFGVWDAYPLTTDGIADPDDQHDALFVQLPSGDFRDDGVLWGFDDGLSGRGLLAVDVNRDGWMDLIKRQLDGPDLLYLSRCGTGHWLTVEAVGDGPNTHGVGAEVEVISADRSWRQQIYAGSTSMYAGGPPRVHVGVGTLERVDAVVVRWAGGGEARLTSVPTDRHITISR